MKRLFGFFLFVTFLSSLSFAGPWGIVVNLASMNIQTIDFGQTPPKVYGPFLTGSLGGATQELLDVAITPDSHYALVSNFIGGKIYRIDISDPTNPVLAGTIYTGSFGIEAGPEDIAISPNGKFAVVSDGGYISKLAFIDLSSFSNSSLYTLTSGLTANAVAIGNDNSTIIMPDAGNSRIIFGRVNATFTGLISETNLYAEGGPLNISISPDGSTVLTAGWDYIVSVFRITGPGTVVPGSPTKITGFHERPQSIAFSTDGKKAYVLSSGYPNSFAWLQVNGPGNVTLGADRAAYLSSYSGGANYGVDGLAVSPNGNYALAGNTMYSSDARNRVTLVNLSTYQATAIDATQIDMASVATFNEAVFPPSNAEALRMTNNYIFYKEHINRLTWEASAKNKFPISTYRIYRKAAGDPDSAYIQISEVDSSVFKHDDRGLGKNEGFIYRITSVTNRGLESPPVEVNSLVFLRRVR